jgi:hypothetical protein
MPENRTNELFRMLTDHGADAPAAPVRVVVSPPCPPPEEDDELRDEVREDEDDPDAWLASLPPVEADPAKEAERRRLLAAIEHKGLRKMVARGTLADPELFHAVGDPDPTAYEAWFARQPKPAFEPIALSDEDRAAIAHVTRHNPPWIRGDYLGFCRKPVRGELFGQGAERPAPANDDAAPPAPAASPLELLRAPVARLLDRGLPRLPDELDLAEAVCALKWPKWPGYEGPVDLDLLRLALKGVAIDAETLNWLGGHELAQECRAAAAAEAKQPQGP